MQLTIFLCESAAADRDGIVAGSHSHKSNTSFLAQLCGDGRLSNSFRRFMACSAWREL
jgi:hypothetical protein